MPRISQAKRTARSSSEVRASFFEQQTQYIEMRRSSRLKGHSSTHPTRAYHYYLHVEQRYPLRDYTGVPSSRRL